MYNALNMPTIMFIIIYMLLYLYMVWFFYTRSNHTGCLFMKCSIVIFINIHTRNSVYSCIMHLIYLKLRFFQSNFS